MKNSIYILFLFLFSLTHAVNGQQELSKESIILTAFSSSMAPNSPSHLDSIIKNWSDNSDQSKADKYWLAFALQQNSIVYLSKGEMEKGGENCQKALDILTSMESPNSEELALLGSLTSMSISFQPKQAMSLSSSASKYFSKSLKLNKDNMRAHLGEGKSDFYTPKMYGGGRKVEGKMQKALSLPVASSSDSESPTWGRDEAYMYLTMFYKRENRKGEAILTAKKGLKEYPNNMALITLLEELQTK